MRQGVTLLELVMVLALVGILCALAFPRAVKWLDFLAVDRSAIEVVSFYQTARISAIFRNSRVRIEFGSGVYRASFEGAVDSVFLVRPGPAEHGVQLQVSRPIIRIQPTGLGFGAANTTLVLRRGTAVESLTTSRLGRLKRWH